MKNGQIDLNESKKIIIDKLTNLNVDKIESIENTIRFYNKMFGERSRIHIFSGVDSAEIKFDLQNHVIRYKYSFKRALILCSCFGIFFWLVSQNYLVGIILFSWLFGLNYVISLFRLRSLSKKLQEMIMYY